MFLLRPASSPVMFRAHRLRENFFVFWHMKVKFIGVHIMHKATIQMP